jgi:hypothetical protein
MDLRTSVVLSLFKVTYVHIVYLQHVLFESRSWRGVLDTTMR